MNLESLPALFENGQDTVIAGCDATDFQWMDCDKQFHPGTKFVPGDGKPLTLQGKKANLSSIIGLADGEYVVIRDKRDEWARFKSLPPVVRKTEPKPSIKPPAPVKVTKESESFDWSSIPWHWLAYILLAGLAALLLFIILGLLRRLYVWMFAPLSARSHTSTTTSNDSPQTYVPNPTNNTNGDNPQGSVVINRAGNMVKRTTTVTEQFVYQSSRKHEQRNK